MSSPKMKPPGSVPPGPPQPSNLPLPPKHYNNIDAMSPVGAASRNHKYSSPSHPMQMHDSRDRRDMGNYKPFGTSGTPTGGPMYNSGPSSKMMDSAMHPSMTPRNGPPPPPSLAAHHHSPSSSKSMTDQGQMHGIKPKMDDHKMPFDPKMDAQPRYARPQMYKPSGAAAAAYPYPSPSSTMFSSTGVNSIPVKDRSSRKSSVSPLPTSSSSIPRPSSSSVAENFSERTETMSLRQPPKTKEVNMEVVPVEATQSTVASQTDLKSAIVDPQQSSDVVSQLQAEIQKIKQSHSDSQKRETALLIRLSKKEGEVQKLMTEIHSLQSALHPGLDALSLRQRLLDPPINMLFKAMKGELDKKTETIKGLKEELDGITFSPNSIHGKKLIAKCRALQNENEELGSYLKEGRVHKLELEIDLRQQIQEDTKKSLVEADEFVVDVDQEMERMQNLVWMLKEKLVQYEPNFTLSDSDMLGTSDLNESSDDVVMSDHINADEVTRQQEPSLSANMNHTITNNHVEDPVVLENETEEMDHQNLPSKENVESTFESNISESEETEKEVRSTSAQDQGSGSKPQTTRTVDTNLPNASSSELGIAQENDSLQRSKTSSPLSDQISRGALPQPGTRNFQPTNYRGSSVPRGSASTGSTSPAMHGSHPYAMKANANNSRSTSRDRPRISSASRERR